MLHLKPGDTVGPNDDGSWSLGIRANGDWCWEDRRSRHDFGGRRVGLARCAECGAPLLDKACQECGRHL